MATCEGPSDDCTGEATILRDTSDGWLKPDHLCAACSAAYDQRCEDGPGDPDGEAFRGGEAAAYERGQMIAWQRLK